MKTKKNQKPTDQQITEALKDQGDSTQEEKPMTHSLTPANNVVNWVRDNRIRYNEDEDDARIASEYLEGVVFCYMDGYSLISCWENGLSAEMEIRHVGACRYQIVRINPARPDDDVIVGTYRSAKAAMTVVCLLRSRSI